MPIAANPVFYCFTESFCHLQPHKVSVGGEGFLFCRHLQAFSLEAHLVTRVGMDEAGKAMIEGLEKSLLPTGFIQVDAELPTGQRPVKDGFTGQMWHPSTPQAWDQISWDPELMDKLPDGCFFYNSLAGRSHVSRATLLKYIAQSPYRIYLPSLQSRYFSAPLMEKGLTKAWVALLTRQELEILTGWSGPLQSVVARAEYLREKFQISYLFIAGATQLSVHLPNQAYTHRHALPLTTDDLTALLAGLVSALLENQAADKVLLRGIDHYHTSFAHPINIYKT